MDAARIHDPAVRQTFQANVESLLERTPTSDQPVDRLAPLRNREKFTERKPRSDVQSGRRKENPLEFIDRVYHDRRLHGLRRIDLAELDKKLYDALGHWLFQRKKSIPEEFGLPSNTELTSQRMAAFGVGPDSLGLSKALPGARAVLKAYSAARGRRLRERNL